MSNRGTCVILIICAAVSLLSGFFLSSQSEGITNRSAAELFPLHQLRLWRGERPSPWLPEYHHSHLTLTPETLASIPAAFSWRDLGIMTRVKDQNLAQCGSCWAFAAVGVFEALIGRSDGIKVDLSEQQLVNCVTECSGCSGGNGFYAHLYMVDNGIVRESVYPYLARDWECDLTAPSEFFLTRAWNYRIIESETRQERRNNIKHILMTYGPVDSVMAVYEDFYYDYRSGIYQYDGSSAFRTYHGVVIAGWVDDASLPTGGYWIVKNCWGESWGENGYFRIAYDPTDVNIIEFDIRYSLYNGLGNDPLYFEDMEEAYQGYEGSELVITDYASDPDGDTIAYSIRDAPPGMLLDLTTGTITWTPDYTQAGDHTIIITITDGTFTIHRKVVINIINVKKIKS